MDVREVTHAYPVIVYEVYRVSDCPNNMFRLSRHLIMFDSIL